jgi:AcrR family transcriptional regulator
MNYYSLSRKGHVAQVREQMTQSRVRPARADAIRNRANILDAARQQITLHGPSVSMNQIAVAAGVAVGTLYRHYPTKTDLVAAAVSEFVTHVADRAESAVSHVDGGSPAFVELVGLLHDIVEASATNYAIKTAADALNADIDDSDNIRRAHRALQSLIESAQADRAVRADLSIDDLYLLISNAPADQPPAVVRRWVDLMLFGIVGPPQ